VNSTAARIPVAISGGPKAQKLATRMEADLREIDIVIKRSKRL
jgi:hypothetical protein